MLAWLAGFRGITAAGRLEERVLQSSVSSGGVAAGERGAVMACTAPAMLTVNFPLGEDEKGDPV